MSKELFNRLSYAAIGIVFALLLLMITKVLPEKSFPYVLGFSIGLLIIRLVLRIYYLIQERKSKE